MSPCPASTAVSTPAAFPAISLHPHASERSSPVPALATPGLVALPGTGRLVWWTGRVAIGLRYQRAGAQGTQTATSSSSAWLQNMLLS